jgi:hypothetical protein
MTQDEIIEMWKNSGDLEIIGMPYSMIEAFAKLVAEKEREACAKVCDDYDVAEDVNTCDTAEGIAIAIRARGQA